LRLAQAAALITGGAVIAACARRDEPPRLAQAYPLSPAPAVDPKYGTSASPRVADPGMRIPKGGGTYKLGQPYRIAGRWYVPQHDPNYDRAGIASFYADDFHGRKTANGEIFDMEALTAAHPTLPMPSYAYVTNLTNGRTLLVRINDRGPYAHDRIIDLSRRVAILLGFERQGTARVQVRYAGPAPLDGNDRHEQAFLARQPWSQFAQGSPPPAPGPWDYGRAPAALGNPGTGLPSGLTWRR
jgi:rare lipoprotein A